MAGANIAQVLENQMIQAASVIEQQVDDQIAHLENMDDDDLEKLREKRLEALKKSKLAREDFLRNGHGVYSEIPEEKEFFDVCKKSKRVVCHFFRQSTYRCQIVDKHLALLAPKHVETRFIKADVEKCNFLVEKLRIKVLPTIALLLDSKAKEYIVGFDELGGIDDFSTDMLEWRLGAAEVINYSGDVSQPPLPESQASTSASYIKNKGGAAKKTIRGKAGGDGSSDEDDW